MSNRKVIIGKICDINASSISSNNLPKQIKYLDTSSITKNKIDTIQTFNTEYDTVPSRAKRKVKNGTIIYSTVRPNLEHFGFMENPEKDLIVSTGFLTLDVIDKNVDPKFLFYKITQPYLTNYLHTVATNNVSAYPSINPSDLGELEIEIPIDLKNQQKIAAVLSALDSKIELNNRINAELESMAKTLYDYWFVQFDFPNAKGKPYKSSGGKMVWNEELKREVPDSWATTTIGEYAEVKKGDLITAKDSKEGNVKVVAAGVSFSYKHSEYNRNKNTITISGSGANAGFINFWREPIFASDCITVRGKTDAETLLLLHHLKFVQNHILNQATGSAQPHVYPSDIKILNYIKPSDLLIQEFGEIVIPMNNRIANNLIENQKLTELRDWLLPMLMNGQVKVG